jgi:hypothetical protein
MEDISGIEPSIGAKQMSESHLRGVNEYDDPSQNKPFSFLANLGGKETSSALLTPKIDENMFRKFANKSERGTIDTHDKSNFITVGNNAETIEKGDFEIKEKKRGSMSRTNSARPKSHYSNKSGIAGASKASSQNRPISSYVP